MDWVFWKDIISVIGGTIPIIGIFFVAIKFLWTKYKELENSEADAKKVSAELVKDLTNAVKRAEIGLFLTIYHQRINKLEVIYLILLSFSTLLCMLLVFELINTTNFQQLLNLDMYVVMMFTSIMSLFIAIPILTYMYISISGISKGFSSGIIDSLREKIDMK